MAGIYDLYSMSLREKRDSKTMGVVLHKSLHKRETLKLWGQFYFYIT